MATIAVPEFADKIEEYLETPDKFDEKSIEATLNSVDPDDRHGARIGIRFDYTIELVMKLLARAYHTLNDGTSLRVFSQETAEAMQNFARPFPEKEDIMCYPHFLMHGIAKPTLEAVVRKINENSRIIHATLKVRDGITKRYSHATVSNDLQLGMVNGVTDDFFGISYLLAKGSETWPHGISGYIAKASFFLDTELRDIYVLTLQGSRFKAIGHGESLSKAERELKGQKEYSRIGNILKMNPRTFILTKVMDFGRENEFKRIRVVKPEEHPMYIEKHPGFLGSYEPVIRKAGVTTENECYLEARL